MAHWGHLKMNAFVLIKKTALNFTTQSYATYKGLFYWLNVLSYTSNVIVRPILGMVIFLAIGSFAFAGDVIRQMAVGVSMGSMNFILLGGLTQSYVYERTMGTIQFPFSFRQTGLSTFSAGQLFTIRTRF